MKKSEVLFVIMLLLATFSVEAQNKSTDYFVGRWELSVQGVPEGYGGYGKIELNLERQEGKLGGIIVLGASGSEKEIKINKVEEKETYLTVYFDSDSGYEVYVFIEKENDDQIKGSIMDMFDVSGKRLK
ncbi:MAG: hypothetical protein LBS88_08170 [Tannerellaceae bacterium]|jgi:hypothetical protein|nr:hypothetical protein [Tannerellaceae bacterium]